MSQHPSRFLTLWAINDELDPARLRSQLNEFAAAGLDGVVFHPRFYPNSPRYLGDDYLRVVSDLILDAKRLSLEFWIYDEDGWPSGTVGGQLLAEHPEDAQNWLDLVEGTHPDALVSIENGGRRYSAVVRVGEGVDYLSPSLGRHFIEMTYERYRDGLAPEAWEYVSAFFDDEPELGLGHAFSELSASGALPWTPELPARYRERFGAELSEDLGDIFFTSQRSGLVRARFWELLSDLFVESYIGPLDEWCALHGKVFTAHLKGEEHPLFQVSMVGSSHRVLRAMRVPGVDALERDPSNDFFPRQASSVARQFGDGRCMVEAFGGAGWGAAPIDLERYLLWLGRNGVSDFVLHLSQFRLDSSALHDWPSSLPRHITWTDVFPEVIARVRRELDENPRPAADTLVVVPQRGIAEQFVPVELLSTNIHNASTYPASPAARINQQFLAGIAELAAAGVPYDVADERAVEDFLRLDDRGFHVGSAPYSRVVLADGAAISDEVRTALAPFAISWSDAIRAAGPVATPPVPVETDPIELDWVLADEPMNELVLEPKTGVGGRFSVGVPALPVAADIVFADSLSAATIDGRAVEWFDGSDGSVIPLPASATAHTVEFGVSGSPLRAFVWLRGRFRVVSATPFEAVAGLARTAGPFLVRSGGASEVTDLIRAGFPFVRESLSVETELTTHAVAERLILRGGSADALHLTVDGIDHGWAWSHAGVHEFDAVIPAGTHRMRLKLVPNGFNVYGPHHYYLGDTHVVSPAQVAGEKNFADPSDAPESTHVKEWFLRPLAVPSTLSLA